MERLLRLLTALCEDIERQIKPNLRGGMAEIIQGYLPQVWVFETDCGACTLFLDTEGNARVFPWSFADADVLIRWKKVALESVLASRSHDCVSPGDYPDVAVATDKGRAAFNFLRKEIGL